MQTLTVKINLDLYAAAPTKSEQEKAAHTHQTIRSFLESEPSLSRYEIDTFLQGSYKNSTNVRKDSDVDRGALTTKVFFQNMPTDDSSQVGGPARQLVVLLHGLGAAGSDLIGLGSSFAPRLPGAAFLAPNAPEPCEASSAGYQWFSLGAEGEAARSAGVRRAAPALERFLDEELDDAGLSDARLALIGFSQGTMMALHVGLRRHGDCAAIVGYSGTLVDAESLAQEVRAKPPIMLIHGGADDLIPADAMFAAVGALGAVKSKWCV